MNGDLSVCRREEDRAGSWKEECDLLTRGGASGAVREEVRQETTAKSCSRCRWGRGVDVQPTRHVVA